MYRTLYSNKYLKNKKITALLAIHISLVFIITRDVHPIRHLKNSRFRSVIITSEDTLPQVRFVNHKVPIYLRFVFQKLGILKLDIRDTHGASTGKLLLVVLIG